MVENISVGSIAVYIFSKFRKRMFHSIFEVMNCILELVCFDLILDSQRSLYRAHLVLYSAPLYQVVGKF